MLQALKEIHRVLVPNGLFLTVIDLYKENAPTRQWIDQLAVPVQYLSIADYKKLFADAGFDDCRDERLIDPTPIPEHYTGGSFKSREDLVEYRDAGSLMLSGRAHK
jgi:hypothetical protein